MWRGGGRGRGGWGQEGVARGGAGMGRRCRYNWGMNKHVIATDKAPAAIGPYSQAVRAGNLIFTAGQVGVDPANQQVVAGGITEQTTRALENLKAILEEAGTSLAKAVKATVFLKDMKDFAAMNAVYGVY